MASRTKNSIRNSLIALIYNIIAILAEFISRKVFIQHLGIELLGLNTTAINLLNFLNLAELGIGSAIATTLYAPLAKKDKQTVNEIISIQGWLFRKIAYTVIAGGIVLMGFFPFIFPKTEFPFWYTYAVFSVLLFSSLLAYFVNYRQIIYTADQKEYKIIYYHRSLSVIKTTCQIIAISYFNHGYIWWLAFQFLFTILASINLNIYISKEYNFLNLSVSDGYKLTKKYPEIITKIKQIFFHRIAGYAVTQTSPLIIYAYTSLGLIAIYGNYLAIISGITLLLYAIFNGLDASVGNLVVQSSQNQILKVLEELFSSRFLFTVTTCFGMYILTSPFICIWFGDEYLLNESTLILLTSILFLNSLRAILTSFINAYGLFSDIYASITETILTLSLSISLGYFYGLNGVLTGVFISSLLITGFWKPYFLFRKGLQKNVTIYFIMLFKHCGIIILSFPIHLLVYKLVSSTISNNYLLLSIGIVSTLIFFILNLLFLSLFCSGMRDFSYRIINIINKNL